jgi:transcription antitermination factor NusG
MGQAQRTHINAPSVMGPLRLAHPTGLAEKIGHPAQQQASPFQIGDSVAVTDGPLKGLSGIVSNIAKERVVVMLTLLGREKPVAFPFKQINRENGAP